MELSFCVFLSKMQIEMQQRAGFLCECVLDGSTANYSLCAKGLKYTKEKRTKTDKSNKKSSKEKNSSSLYCTITYTLYHCNH